MNGSKKGNVNSVRVRSRWLGRTTLALWLGSIAFCLQFAVASAAELERQAAIMGWMLTAILLVVGLAVWGARRVEDPRRRDDEPTPPNHPI